MATGRNGRSGLTEARGYHPRGRSVREGTRERSRNRSEEAPPEQVREKSRRSADREAQPPPARRPRSSRPTAPAKPPKLASSKRRLRLATVLALAMFAALGIRLVELQVTDGPAYAASGLESRLQTVVLPASRGAIYDRNGAVLAHSVEARLVYADPELVVNPERVAAALQPLLAVPASDLAERMQPRLHEDGSPSRYEWLARGVDLATAEQIMGLNLPGIGVHRDERRIVPGHDLAANVIGFTGTDLANLEGLEGLEAYHDEVLRGVDGERTYERGLGITEDREIPGGYRAETPPQPGSDVHLTLDMDLQYEVQRVLAEKLREIDATFGTAVLLEAGTGEVLAQASYPTYNAADPLAASEQERTDAATTVVFDPGSAHKPLVFGAALEEGVIAPGDSLVVDPTVTKGDQLFQDTVWHPAGTRMSLAAVMAFSSNVGTIMVADRLGSEELYAYQRAFGLGEVTGVGMPGEVAGGLLAPEDWYASSHGSVPIGHSVDATALQLAAAYGAIANDGVWVQPQLLRSVTGPDEDAEAVVEPERRRVLSGDTAAYLRELMEAVVAVPDATGVNAAVDGYRVAGKTGTGMLVADGEYLDGDVSSFIGMAPADQPRYVLAVSAHASGGGASAVNTAFQEMMGFTLQHYRVPPATTEVPAFDLYP